MRPVAEQMAARLFGPGPSEKLTQEIMAMMLATNPAGAAAAVRGRAERPDYQPVLKALTRPGAGLRRGPRLLFHRGDHR